jgi:hypothetical protein
MTASANMKQRATQWLYRQSKRTRLVIALVIAACLVMFAPIPIMFLVFTGVLYDGPGPKKVVLLHGATEEEVRQALGEPALVLGNQHELDILTTCYQSFDYRCVAGEPSAMKGWISSSELPPVSQKAFWYERRSLPYLIYFEDGKVVGIYLAGT